MERRSCDRVHKTLRALETSRAVNIQSGLIWFLVSFSYYPTGSILLDFDTRDAERVILLQLRGAKLALGGMPNACCKQEGCWWLGPSFLQAGAGLS